MSLSKFVVFLLIFNSNFLAALTGYRPQQHTLAKYIVFLTMQKVKYDGDQQFCAGSVLSAKKVLTAGHCLVNSKTLKLKNTRDLFVVAGSPFRLYAKVRNAQVMRVRKLLVHGNFDYEKAIADVGIVVLHDDIKTNANVQFLSLPKTAPILGEKCTLLGWGRVYAHGPNPDEVLYTDLFILSKNYCQDAIMPVGMVCAGNPFHSLNDACEGDSGGPLICNDTVYGIVSFGAGCGVPFYAGVYTDVWYYKDWIEHNAAAVYFSSKLINLFILVVCLLIKSV